MKDKSDLSEFIPGNNIPYHEARTPRIFWIRVGIRGKIYNHLDNSGTFSNTLRKFKGVSLQFFSPDLNSMKQISHTTRLRLRLIFRSRLYNFQLAWQAWAAGAWATRKFNKKKFQSSFLLTSLIKMRKYRENFHKMKEKSGNKNKISN